MQRVVLEEIRRKYAERILVRRDGPPDPSGKAVVYWMQRAQRALDNPALDVAVEIANALRLPCVVFFAPVPYYPHANLRHYHFLQEGIPGTARRCAERNIGFVLRRHPEHSLLTFCAEVGAAIVVGDENPMREPRAWRDHAAKKLSVPLWTVDADVIVPSRLLLKEQYSARIIRPRLKVLLPKFLVVPTNPTVDVRFSPPRGLKSLAEDFDITADWELLDRSVLPVEGFKGGTDEALRRLDEFIRNRLPSYPERHNQADTEGTSALSPYLHFGHIGPHTVVMAVQNAKAPVAAKEDFLDQLITWRELSINFVHFNPVYDSIECGPDWAHRTLAEHAKDPRPHLYSRSELEQAKTEDELWNAAQLQMLHAGWMHNYMRMYWSKKILEWSSTPAVAYQTAVYLNDKYFLDGRDPNGYAGIAWSMVGKFDRPWFERPIFGTVRYMATSGAKKKFDVKKYVRQMNAPAAK